MATNTHNLPQNTPSMQHPTRRQFLTYAALWSGIALYDQFGDDPAAWPPEAQDRLTGPTPPILPLGRDFESLAELTEFITAMRAYIDAEAKRVDQATPEALAVEINRRIVESAVLCAHLSDRPELRDQVLNLLHLDEDTKYDIALMADDYRRHPEYRQSDEDRADLRRHLWGRQHIEIPGRVCAKTWDRYEFEQSFLSALGGGYTG